MDYYEDEATSLSDLENESLRQTHIRTLLKITTLQGHLGQIKLNLQKREKDVEYFRRRTKNELSAVTKEGANYISTSGAKEIVTFIELLEEQNRDLRALSSIPIEIDKLKAEITGLEVPKRSFDSCGRSFPGSETSTGKRLNLSSWPEEAMSVKQDLVEMQAKWRAECEARQHLENVVVPGLERTRVQLEQEIQRLRNELFPSSCKVEVSFQDNEPFTKPEERLFVRSLTPAVLSVAVKSSSRLTPRSVAKSKGYTPTFLRQTKARKHPKAKTKTCDN